MTKAELLFLGTGASAGIPMIGCHCEVCMSSDPHNQRWRPSALLLVGDQKFLIDCGPDFRAQALKFGIEHLDGLLLTHSHFDHVAGLDELRIYYLRTRKPLPILLSESTWSDLKKRYEYLFREPKQGASLTAQFAYQLLEQTKGYQDFMGLKVQCLEYEQGSMKVTGYRFGSLAYITDIRYYPETLFEDLNGVETLILSALRTTPSLMHFNLEEAVQFAHRVGAKKTYLTHMSHELEHRSTNQSLTPEVQLGFDGLKIEFDYDR